MSKFKSIKQPLMLSLKEYLFLISLIPNWAKTIPSKGLHPMFYGTASYEGDKKVVEKMKAIHRKVFPGDFVEDDFEMYYPEDYNEK